MSITLTSEQEEIINEKLQSGRYQSAAEVIDKGLRLLEEAEAEQAKLEWLRAEVNKGLEQLERGEFTTWDSAEALAEHIKAEGRRRLAELESNR